MKCQLPGQREEPDHDDGSTVRIIHNVCLTVTTCQKLLSAVKLPVMMVAALSSDAMMLVVISEIDDDYDLIMRVAEWSSCVMMLVISSKLDDVDDDLITVVAALSSCVMKFVVGSGITAS